MSKRRLQISMQTMFAVMTVMIAYWRLPGGREVLITVGSALLVGGLILGTLMLIQWPILLIITRNGRSR